ncbi:MAG: hypothetical protein ACEY3J_00760 [Arsenophonus sp.]
MVLTYSFSRKIDGVGSASEVEQKTWAIGVCPTSNMAKVVNKQTFAQETGDLRIDIFSVFFNKFILEIIHTFTTEKQLSLVNLYLYILPN